MDKRSSEAKFLEKERNSLIAAVGGAPTTIQSKLIEQAARLALRMQLMDMQAMADAEFSERNGRQYLAWSNTYCRTLAQIASSAKAAKKPTASLEDYLAKRAESAL